MSTLLELARRCEQAAGRDRELDRAIESVCAPERVGRIEWALLEYTSSLDAAMTLVPEGLDVHIDRVFDDEELLIGAAWIEMSRNYCFTCHKSERPSVRGDATTPPLALCAAALRARAASADTRPEGGDSTKIEAPFTGGAVPHEDAADAQPTPVSDPISNKGER